LDDYIKAIDDIPDNVLNLLAALEKLDNNYQLKIKRFVNICEITLQNVKFNANEEENRKWIVISIFDAPCSYLICLFENNLDTQNKKNFKPIYEIKVEGDNNFRLIEQDIKDLIKGKKGTSFRSNYPL
jgi:hypothetical protein